MAYVITKKVFPEDIAYKIVSFLENPKQEQWAKYWKDEACRNMSKVVGNLDISQRFDNGTMNYILHYTNVEIAQSMRYRKDGLVLHMKYALDRLLSISMQNKYTIKKLYSRILTNNENRPYSDEGSNYYIVMSALKMLL